MKYINIPLLFLLVLVAFVARSRADDWMTWPSTYTHSHITGQRVDQHTQPVEPIAPQRTDLQRSGYRHYRSTLQAGESADNIHIVEQWGTPVMPYEAWRFPFRPYGSPYPAWGPPTPYGLFNANIGFQGANHYGYGHPMPHGNYGPAIVPPNQTGNYSNYQGSNLPNNNYNLGPYSNGLNGVGGINGFPLIAPYQNAPWLDGSYPAAPPLDPSTDRDFFYKPQQ